MSEEDISLSEKRVYADATDATTAFVGTASGVVRVSVSDDIVGEFSLEWTGQVTDIASADGRLAIATPDDVFARFDDAFHETGFGSASAVGYGEHGTLLAAGDGRIARHDAGWERLGAIEDVRAIDGGMVAARSGVHRLDGTHVGLEDVHDISTAGTPLAATGSGLYYLANGWVRDLEGSFSVVASDGTASHAATSETLYRSDAPTSDWTATELPVGGTVSDVAYAGGVYAVTENGTFLGNVGDGWRYRSLGVPDVTGLAIL
jgi:hypothetical protein